MQCSIGSCSTTKFALLDKSDRFPGMMDFISFPLGYGFFFSYSFSLMGLEGGDEQSKSLICWKDMVNGGCELSLAEEVVGEFPLKMVLKDGSKMDLQAIDGSMEVVFRIGEEECLASERDLDVSKTTLRGY